MSITLSSMRIAVEIVFFSLAWSISAPSAVGQVLGQVDRAEVAHRDLVQSLVFSVISVHRLDECTTPTCCCGERTLQASLNVIQGCPVSNSIVSILRQRSRAGMRL